MFLLGNLLRGSGQAGSNFGSWALGTDSGNPYTSNQAYAGSLDGLMSGGIFGAISGGLKGAAQAEEQQYQRGLDSWNKELSMKQFNESVRQYDQNREDNMMMWKNNITNSLSQYEKFGINPMAAAGVSAGSAVSGSVSGSNVTSGSSSGQPSQFNPALMQQAFQNKFVANENSLQREFQKGVVTDQLKNARDIADSNSQSQKELKELELSSQAGIRQQQEELLAAQVKAQKDKNEYDKWVQDYWKDTVGVPPDSYDKIKGVKQAFGEVKGVVDKVPKGKKKLNDSGKNWLAELTLPYSMVKSRLNSCGYTYEQYKSSAKIRRIVHGFERED